MEETHATSKYRKVLKQLQDEYEANGWRSHYLDLSHYILPRKGKYLAGRDEKPNDGKKKHQHINNECATNALRIQTCGIHGGMTPQSKPWFALTLQNEDLVEYEPVRAWLHEVRNIMLDVFSRSNYYESAFNNYEELGCFGTGVNLLDEDYQTVIRCRPFTTGEYLLAQDSSYRPTILYRQYSMTARQMVEAFGEENCSESVRTAVKTTQGERYFEIIHCIQPITEQNGNGYQYESVYFEYKNNYDNFLRKKGYMEKPFSVCRWDINGVNTYGDSYAMDVLPDIKMLQNMEEKKLKALAKMVDPPVNAPIEMKQRGGTIIAGGVNYYDPMRGTQGMVPVYQVQPDLQKMAFEIDRVETRIRRGFFNDVFITILGADKQMTATEVAQRHEEKLIILGPVIMRIQSDKLDPEIKRTYAIMDRFGLLPPMPPEMEGQNIKIEYISLLAQAQKMVGTASIEQLGNFVGGISQFIPNVIDKFDADEAVDEYGQMIGVPPKIVRSDDKVAEIREERMKQEQMAAMAEQLKNSAQGAQQLSNAKLDQNSVLDQLIGNLGEVR